MATQLNFAQQMDAVLKTLGDARPRLLLHACCGPCSSAVLEQLCQYFDITVLYYNPNTWPAEEYYRRGEELKKFVAAAHPLGVTVVEDTYDPQEFYTAVQGLEAEPERGGHGAVVDVGGGTTGISILKDGKVIYTDDEATGGSHMTMTVAGHYKIPYEEAEVLKTTPEKEDEIFPVIKATIEKMATITERFLKGYEVPAVYVVGGSASFKEFTTVFEKKLRLPVYRPVHPLLVTPLGIAYNCILPPVSPKKN